MSIMYCPNCGRNVDVSKWTGTRIAILIILLILGLIPGLVYLIYIVTLDDACQTCKTPASMLQGPRFNTGNSSQEFVGSAHGDSGFSYCPNCGARCESGIRFCSNCGRNIEK